MMRSYRIRSGMTPLALKTGFIRPFLRFILLSSLAGLIGTASAQLPAGWVSGQGLQGTLYEFGSGLSTRDRSVLFGGLVSDAAFGSPSLNTSDVPNPPFANASLKEYYADRWLGAYTAPAAEDDVFSIIGDDGVKLWLSDKEIDPANPGTATAVTKTGSTGASDPWVDQSSVQYDTASMHLTKGQIVYILFEHYQWTGSSVSDLKINGSDIDPSNLSGPALPTFGTLTGTVKDSSGAALSTTIEIVTSSGSRAVQTDASGAFAVQTPPGDYTFASASDDMAIQNNPSVTVATGKTTTAPALVLSSLPAISLDPADAPSGTTWRFNTMEDKIWDFAAADPNYKEVGTWTTPSIPEDAGCTDQPGNGCYYWYRVTFNLPSDFQTATNEIVVDRYAVEDNDFAWVNGIPIGFSTTYADETARRYQVPNDILNYGGSNLLAIKGNHGRTGGGMHWDGYTPRIRQSSKTGGRVIVYLRDKSRTSQDPPISYTPAMNVPVTLYDANGAAISTVLSDQAGYSWFQDIAPGKYTVKIDGTHGLKSATPSSADVTVTALKSTDLEPNIELLDVAPGDSDARDDAFAGSSLDSKWTSVVWGDAGGSVSVKDGVLTLSATGDFIAASDEGRFIYQKVKGDFVAAVKVLTSEFVDSTANGRARAGLMVRADDSDSAVNALMHIAPYQRGAFFQWRANKGDTATNGDASYYETGANLPVWLILRRVGTNVAGFISYDGQKASMVYQLDLPNLPDEALVGPAWAPNATDEASATYSNFTLRDVTTAAATVKGDINGDGKVNVQDATLSLRIAVGLLTPTDAQKTADDVNGDGKYSVADSTLILRLAVGLITSIP